MKAEQNPLTNSRWKERWTKGPKIIKSRCEKTVAKTKTYNNKKPKHVNSKHFP